MRRMHKKGALELSINAIVIVILAMTLLGLGLGFVRNMFRDIGDTTEQVQEQMKEQILDDLRRGDKKLSFPSASLQVEKGEEEVIVIGVKNTGSQTLNFRIRLFEIVGTDSVELGSTSKPVDGNKYGYFWDTTPQTLSAGEPNVFPITLSTENDATGTRLFKIIIDESSTADITTCLGGADSTACAGITTASCQWSVYNNTDAGDDICTTVPDEFISKTFFVKFT